MLPRPLTRSLSPGALYRARVSSRHWQPILVKHAVEWDPIPWAFASLITGMIVMAFSMGLMPIVYIPFFLVCLALSITAIGKHRVMAGVLTMLLCVILPPIEAFLILALVVSMGISIA